MVSAMVRPELNTVVLDFFENTPGGCNCIIDIPHCLSLYNRKSYRSGYVYSVDFIEYIGSQGDIVSIGKIPETYSVLNAYRTGYEAWKDQRHEAIDDTGIEPGRWSDFKPYLSIEHMDGTWPELMPGGLGTGLGFSLLDTTGHEWNHADLVTNDYAAATTTTVRVGMLGANDLPNFYGSLMEASGDTRAPTLSPDPLTPVLASGSWITRTGEAAAEMSSDVIDLVESENELPPYANQNDPTLPPTYVGGDQSAPRGVLVDRAVTGATGRPVSLDGGLIPLGLLTVEVANAEGFYLRVHCTRGEYKGVAALPMGAFK